MKYVKNDMFFIFVLFCLQLFPVWFWEKTTTALKSSCKSVWLAIFEKIGHFYNILTLPKLLGPLPQRKKSNLKKTCKVDLPDVISLQNQRTKLRSVQI